MNTSFENTRYIINEKEITRKELIIQSKEKAKQFFKDNPKYPGVFYHRGIMIRQFEYNE